MYQGWKNYETWNVSLHLDNEEGSYRMAQEWTRESWTDARDDSRVEKGTWTREQAARFILADKLKNAHEENQPELSGVWGDLLSAALSEVDWDEIASHYIADLDKEDEEEEADTAADV